MTSPVETALAQPDAPDQLTLAARVRRVREAMAQMNEQGEDTCPTRFGVYTRRKAYFTDWWNQWCNG